MSRAEVISTIRQRLPSFSFDGAWTATGLILLALALFDAKQFPASIEFLLTQIIHVLPFLALAIGLAAYAKASSADRLIAHAFSGHVVLMIIMAALLGGLSPFCSCGVIPLIAALLTMGVPLPAVMAFWLSSPLMDPSMFFLTVGTLGLTFALAKTAAAVGVGLMGGFAVLALGRSAVFANPLKPGIGDGGCGASAVRETKPIHWKFWHEKDRSLAFVQELSRSFLFLSKWLVLAFLLESLMIAYVPGEWIAQSLGHSGIGGIAIAALVGVPAYLNGYAALPLMSGLVDAGMDPGAAMAFLIAGGVSSFPAAIAVFALVKLPVFLSYLLLAFAGAVLSGALFSLIV
ncbi:MAG: permease [Hyphomicrobiaceae bacterium]|nr:permease [Hyphomicrobiaceae bacterium]